MDRDQEVLLWVACQIHTWDRPVVEVLGRAAAIVKHSERTKEVADTLGATEEDGVAEFLRQMLPGATVNSSYVPVFRPEANNNE